MVEDNEIKADVSPFAIREGEIKTFDGKDGYVSMNQIIRKIDIGHITDIHFKIIELVNERNSKEIEELYETYKENVALSLISVINMFDPKRISIGGSLSYFVEADLEEIVRRVNESTFYRGTGENNIVNYEIVKAILENDAGLIGAAMLEKYTI